MSSETALHRLRTLEPLHPASTAPARAATNLSLPRRQSLLPPIQQARCGVGVTDPAGKGHLRQLRTLCSGLHGPPLPPQRMMAQCRGQLGSKSEADGEVSRASVQKFGDDTPLSPLGPFFLKIFSSSNGIPIPHSLGPALAFFFEFSLNRRVTKCRRSSRRASSASVLPSLLPRDLDSFSLIYDDEARSMMRTCSLSRCSVPLHALTTVV